MSTRQESDILITNGYLFDGTGKPKQRGDVIIRGDRIVYVGKKKQVKARKVIDATNLGVAPGFIDLHSHADFPLSLQNCGELMEPFIRQGVTTVVTGNCGFSPAPVNRNKIAFLKEYTNFLSGDELPWEWLSLSEFFRFLEAHGLPLNVAQLVGHGTLRIAVLGMENRQPTSQQMTKMIKLLSDSLEDGAFGMSLGLMYAPGMFATTDELIRMARLVAKYDGLIASHLRGYSDILIPAVKELIKIGESTGCCLELSHLGPFGRYHWDKVDAVFDLIETARKKGVRIGFDMIPWPTGNTSLTTIFPAWALEGGRKKFLERLRDFSTRQQMEKDMEEFIPSWPPWERGGWTDNMIRCFGWNNLHVLSVNSKKHAPLIGKSLQQIADNWGQSPFEVATELILEEKGDVYILFDKLLNENTLQKLLVHPLSSIVTDAISLGRGMPTPSLYGTFPRLLGHYARDLQLISQEEAIRKITSLPARIIGLKDRGKLAKGMFADITIFNPLTVRDRSSYFQKHILFPLGIEYVLINGQIVIEKGYLRPKVRPGRILRKDC